MYIYMYIIKGSLTRAKQRRRNASLAEPRRHSFLICQNCPPPPPGGFYLVAVHRIALVSHGRSVASRGHPARAIR